MNNTVHKTVGLFFMALLICFGSASAVQVTFFKVAVTYFDYHADGSWQDDGGHHGWPLVPMCDTLGPSKVPLRCDSLGRGPCAFSKMRWDLWFTPWSDTGKICFPAESLYTKMIDSANPVPEMTDTGEIMTYPIFKDTVIWRSGGMYTGDTAYKNIMVKDSLEFILGRDTVITLLGPATYTSDYDTTVYDTMYQAGSNTRFFPINGRGFLDQKENQGYAGNNGMFTMMLHNRVRYGGHEIIACTGDDNVAVYLNNRIVINDWGRGNGKPYGIIKVDSVAAATGMTAGHDYDIDVFFAERCPGGSRFQLTTNLQFLNARSGTREVKIKNPGFKGYSVQNGISVLVFKGRQMILPARTARASFACFSLSGRLLGQRTIAPAALLRKPVFSESKAYGLVVIRAECRDREGMLLPTATGLFPGPR